MARKRSRIDAGFPSGDDEEIGNESQSYGSSEAGSATLTESLLREHAGSPGKAAPGSPAPSTITVATSRKRKWCKLCEAHPEMETPLVGGHLREKWGAGMPWGAGTPERPIGNYDAICIRTYQTGAFDSEHGNINAYQAYIAKHPQQHTKFIKCRSKWVELHNRNPNSRLRRAHIMPPEEIVTEEIDQDALEAPDYEFVELSNWQQENKHLMPKDSKELPTPELVGLKTETETFRDKILTGVWLMTGKPGHYKLKRSSARAVLKRKVENDGETNLDEGQSEQVRSAAGSAMLRNIATSISVDDVIASLTKHAASAVSSTTDQHSSHEVEYGGAVEEPDSDLEDAEADAAIEQSAPRFSKAAANSAGQSLTGAKANGRASSASSRVATGSAVKALTAPARSPAKVVKPQGASRAIHSKGKAIKLDIEKEQAAADVFEHDLAKLRVFGEYRDVRGSKASQDFTKAEKVRQREAQTLANAVAAKLKAKEYRLDAPEGLLSKVSKIKEGADQIFKLSKTMCQASVSNILDIQSLIEDMVDDGAIEIPAQYITVFTRFLFVDAVKFSKFTELSQILSMDSWVRQRLMVGGMTPEDVDDFLSGEVEDSCAKIMKMVTLKDIQAGVTPEGSALGRLHKVYDTLLDSRIRDPDLRKSLERASALVRPESVDIMRLSDVVDSIGQDQPPAMLAPFTGCPPGKAFISHACNVYESRAKEVAFVKFVDSLASLADQLSTVDDSEKLDTLKTIRALELPALDGDTPAVLKCRLASANSQVDRWVMTELYKPVVSTISTKLGQLVHDIKERKQCEVEFEAVDALKSLQAWGSDPQQLIMERLITMVSFFRDIQQLNNDGLSGTPGNMLSIKGCDIVGKLKAAVSKNRACLAEEFDFHVPDDLIEVAKATIKGITEDEYNASLAAFSSTILKGIIDSKDSDIKPAAFGVSVHDKGSTLLRLAATCLSEEHIEELEHRVEVMKHFVAADLNRRMVMSIKAKVMAPKPLPPKDSVNGIIGKYRRAVALLSDAEKIKDALQWILGCCSEILDKDAKLEAISIKMGDWHDLARSVAEKRGMDLMKYCQKDLDIMKEKVDKAPPCIGSAEMEEAFLKHMTNEKVNDAVAKAEANVALVQASMKEACVQDQYTVQMAMAKPHFRCARVLVASMGLLALLGNKFLNAKTVKGKALRDQLEGLRDIISKDELKVNEVLLMRVHCIVGSTHLEPLAEGPAAAA